MAESRKKFEDELRDLEGIVEQLDSGQLPLEESLRAFERGVALLRSLNQKLEQAERRIEVLVKNAKGELESAPLENQAALGAEKDLGKDPAA